MTALTFTVPGDARGKGRPRATTISGHARMFTDAKTASYENLVRLAAREALGARQPFAGPVALDIIIRVSPPRSASRKVRAKMLEGALWPAKKPDLSNIVKAIEDGANTVAFLDDVQVVHSVATKRYAETAGVDVSITPLGDGA